MPRHSFIAWILIKGRLPVNKRLQKFIPDTVLTCDLCNEGEETQDHLFFDCKYARAVWEKVTDWVGVKVEASTLQEWTDYILKYNRQKAYREVLYGIITATIYHLWRVRNEVKFQGRPTGWKATAFQIKEHVQQRVLYIAQKHHRFQKCIDIVLDQ